MWDNMYRYREANVNSTGAGDYQSANPIGYSIGYPIGYPIGGYVRSEN